MVERDLTRVQKASFILATVMSLGFFVGFGVAAIAAPRQFPWEARAAFAAGSLFGLAFAAVSIAVLRRGRLNLKLHGTAQAGLAWGVVLINFILTSQIASRLPNAQVAAWMMITSLAFLVIGAVFLLQNTIQQSALKTEEEILRLQIQVAGLTEKLGQTS
jgi:hypothetical protein